MDRKSEPTWASLLTTLAIVFLFLLPGNSDFAEGDKRGDQSPLSG